MKKHVIAGLGEIGLPIMKIMSKVALTVGYDIDTKKFNKTKFDKYKNVETSFLHICIPFTKKFNDNILCLYKKFKPKIIVIHSTIPPNTTEKLQSKLDVPIIYSATRGVHKRMLYDLKRYTKFFAIDPQTPKAKWASLRYSTIMKKCGIKTKKMSKPITLELAKIICDTSYYGWLITYSQLSNMIALKNNVSYDEMWSFADEIHKFLGNRPKMFPGIIGGHCVIPNLELINDKTLDLIAQINSDYAKILKKMHYNSRQRG